MDILLLRITGNLILQLHLFQSKESKSFINEFGLIKIKNKQSLKNVSCFK